MKLFSEVPHEHFVLKFYESANLVGTLALPLLMKFNQELHEKGYGDKFGYTHANYEVLYCVLNNKCIGFICFVRDKEESYINIRAAYIEPEYRKSSKTVLRELTTPIYDIMFQELIKHVQTDELVRIFSGTHINNKKAQKAFARQGREVTGYTYKYDVPAKIKE